MLDPMTRPQTRIRLRLIFGEDGRMFGPGKADLLEGISTEGSIAAAGRRMGMSYRRAWTLVEEMNRAFLEPLVTRTRGGVQGGGASLTETGATILASYRALEDRVGEAGADEIARMQELLSDMSSGK